MLKLVNSTANFRIPSDVVMAEHYPLRIASSTTGVDQSAALVNCDPSQASLELIITKSFAMNH